MSRRTQFFLAGAAGALAAAAIATGVAAQVRSDQDITIDAQVRARAEAARDAAQAAREAADAVRDHVRREVRDHRVRVERNGDTMVMHADHDGADRADHLRNILQLRPNQEAALTAYLEAMKPKDRMIRVDRDGENAPKTTTEKLARMEQRLADRQAAERGRIDATRRFYNQLDAAQKRAFDELPLMMGPGDGPMHMVRFIRDSLMGDMPHIMFPPERFQHPPMPPAPPVPPTPPTPPAPPRF